MTMDEERKTPAEGLKEAFAEAVRERYTTQPPTPPMIEGMNAPDKRAPRFMEFRRTV